jgi:putative endonuclease
MADPILSKILKARMIRDKYSWTVYIVKCTDDSLYTGIAKNLNRRIIQHNKGAGAKYTRGRGPVELVAYADMLTHKEADRLERYIKKLPKKHKISFLNDYNLTTINERIEDADHTNGG